MDRRSGQRTKALQTNERLLVALAEQLKTPFMQIARGAELAQLSADPKSCLSDIELSADTALRLIDGYLLGMNLANHRQTLELAPISVSSVLHNTAHELSKLAAQHNCELQLHLSGNYAPVLVHQAGLQAALTSLGAVFIEAQSTHEHTARPVLKLAAHKGKNGIVAGVFADTEGLSSDMFRRAHALYGRARQSFSTVSSSSGAGVFVAESILNLMSTPLHVAHHQKLSGLAATLKPSRQLTLV